MTSRADLPSKVSGSILLITFDFTSDLAVGETISSQSVTASVWSGTDSLPSDIISGAATVSGAIVTQKIDGGVTGVIYELLCTATTSLGQTLQQIGFLSIVPKEP